MPFIVMSCSPLKNQYIVVDDSLFVRLVAILHTARVHIIDILRFMEQGTDKIKLFMIFTFILRYLNRTIDINLIILLL